MEESTPAYGQPRVAEAVNRVKGIFLEVPGTRLSLDEASRLAGLEPTTCRAILEALHDTHFLKCSRDGLFSKSSD